MTPAIEVPTVGDHRELATSPGKASPSRAARTTPETVLVRTSAAVYSQLIARRVREAKVYCELIPGTAPIEKIRELNPRGLILSGGPASVVRAPPP